MSDSKPLRLALETTREITRWRINPYNCLYHNPNKYTIVHFARWTQRYSRYTIYMTLLRVADITGYEPVPVELLQRHAARMGMNGRKVRAGNMVFYLIKPYEMTNTLRKRYQHFKETILNDLGKNKKTGETK